MANALTSIFANVRANLSKLEAALVTLISAQAIVASLVSGIPQVAKYVDGAFAVVVVAAALLKNFLANTASPPAASRRR